MKKKLFDSHMHTPLCKHADGQLREYVDQGWRAALDGVVFTCHCPMPNGFSSEVRMSMDELWDYIALVDEAADVAPEGFEVRLGLESEYFPGIEDWLEKIHEVAPFDFIIGSVNWFLPELSTDSQRGDFWAFYCQYYEHLALAAESGLFDCLAHPDCVKAAFVKNWDPMYLKPVIERSLDRIANTGVAMELDTSGAVSGCNQGFSNRGILTLMEERGIPVVLGSDSYQPKSVGNHFESALDLLNQTGYKSVCSFEKHKKQEIAIDEALMRLEESVVSVV